jgi:uncharacterized protein (TIGR00251 family)
MSTPGNHGPYRWEGEDLVLQLRVQPRASRNELAGVHGDRLKVRLTAPPVEGKANAQLQRFLAALFGVGRNRVHIESGASGRNKCVRIEGPVGLPESLTNG